MRRLRHGYAGCAWAQANAAAVNFKYVLIPAEARRRSAGMESTCRPVQPADPRLRATLLPVPFHGCNSRRQEVAGRCCRLDSATKRIPKAGTGEHLGKIRVAEAAVGTSGIEGKPDGGRCLLLPPLFDPKRTLLAAAPQMQLCRSNSLMTKC